MDRRQFLIAAGAASTLAVAGCAPIAQRVAGRRRAADVSVPKRGGNEAHRYLHRVAFGPIPGDHQQFVAMGRDAFLAEQLAPTNDDEPMLKFLLSRLDVMRVSSAELRDLPEGHVMRQLRQAAILRAVYSRWQVRERLTDFWTNHFNIFAFKGDNAYRKNVDDLQVVRKHALGKFPDMVRASATSAAMLGYLDAQVNRAGVPNENYARELLELHTLGVYGGYSQRDVAEVARCFTGWTIEQRFMRPKDQFRFDPDVHDKGEKIVLGHRIPAGGGTEDGERVIEIVTQHPSCAKFISTKLTRFFLGEGGDAIQPKVEDAYLKTKGDIVAMLMPILTSDAMLDGPPVLKRPYDYLVSSLRAIDAQTDGGEPIQQHLDAMGQPLYGWPMPDGYPDRTGAWTGTLLARWNFAHQLAHGEIAGSPVDLKGLDPLQPLILGHGNEGRDPDEAAALLASPDFQWR